MLESSDLVAFVAATDLPRARAFYEQTLGLPVLEHNDFACVLDAHGTMLRVTAVARGRPRWVHRARLARPGPRGGHPGAHRSRRHLPPLRGHEPGRPRHLDDPGGAQVAWFADPDGNTLSLTQDA